MRLHVVSLPHTQLTDEFSACAYSNKVRYFCRMMKDRGHTVFLYAGEQADVEVDEHIVCISEAARAQAVGSKHYTEASFDPNAVHWKHFNGRAIDNIALRAEPRDFLCLIAGTTQKPIADALPHLMAVEFGVGYSSTFAKYRVFESYAWMHTVYGAAVGNAARADGVWFDEVIPGYLDPERFPLGAHDGGYFLFVGRLIGRKGVQIAADVCEKIGARLILAGPGSWDGYGEHVGVVGPEERARLMGGASALLAPTTYIEPFGNVAIEAMACGTPVISTDWGAFTETVIPGETGYRCRTQAQFIRAMENLRSLPSASAIRRIAVDSYSIEHIGGRYQDYFERLLTVWGKGWYA